MWFYESPYKYVREFFICDYKYSLARIQLWKNYTYDEN